MTVQQLIDKLNEIEDKSVRVQSVSEHGEWTPINYIHELKEENCIVLNEYSFIEGY